MTLLGDGILAEEHARVLGTINYEVTLRDPHAARAGRGGRSSMDEARARRRRRRGAPTSSAAPSATSSSDGRCVDVDVACADPERAGRRPTPTRPAGALFPLSERHGAWRVAFRDGRTVDFTPLRRDARRGSPHARLHRERDRAARRRRRARSIRSAAAPTSTPGSSAPSRTRSSATTRSGCCARSGSRTSSASGSTRRPRRSSARDAALVDRPAGERILAELVRLSENGFRRLDELGLLAPLGGDRSSGSTSTSRSTIRTTCSSSSSASRAPPPARLERDAPLRPRLLRRARPPEDGSPRAIHRFRRATEPWALEALAYVGAGEHADAVREARAADPAEPLLRGDELGLPPGPEVGRLLELVEEERAAGTIATREEALELVRRKLTSGT